MNDESQRRQTIRVVENHLGFPPFIIMPNDVFEFVKPCITRTNKLNPAGSILFVIKATTDTPYNEISASGFNWICSTQFGISCWATLENCISRGILVKIN